MIGLVRVPLARCMATKAMPKIYSFKQMKQFVESPERSRILVDVREPKELEAYRMPTSVNISVKSISEALRLNNDQFQEKFNFDKPGQEKQLVFFCARGVRAKAAEEAARNAGYTNTAVYEGSITDWLANGGAAIKPK